MMGEVEKRILIKIMTNCVVLKDPKFSILPKMNSTSPYNMYMDAIIINALHSFISFFLPSRMSFMKKIKNQQLVFQCVNDTKTNPPTKQESHVNPQSGVRTLEATAEITLAYFEQFFVSPFHCECIARNSGGEVKSRPAMIVLARKSLKAEHKNSQHMFAEKIQ